MHARSAPAARDVTTAPPRFRRAPRRRAADVMTRRVLVAWSSGKDSAWMLSLLERDPAYQVAALMTTFDERHAQVSMHGVPRTLVAAQAAAAGLPLWEVPLPWPCPNEIYAARMRAVIARARDEHVTAVAFGDLFLADIRAWRERQLADCGLDALFPLWRTPADSAALAHTMIAGGLQATLCALDTTRLAADLLGRAFDHALLDALPPDVDPCGEHGEFHTFCTHAPCFAAPVAVVTGARTLQDGVARCT
ncbi:MAG: ATP-binding protein, partial [Gammaproteobacteria bacterium]